MNMNDIKLTKTVKKGGCAAKIAASVLREMLLDLRFPPRHEALLIDGSAFDDAAVYQVSDEIALVQTLDFFTPIVNDPYSFGQVAAANALSDVYAMGGEAKTCMAILAFPLATMPPEIGTAILQGASDKIAEAGATLVGGHSIDDDTLKFGLSVTGYVHPERVWSNAGALPGDALILTKPVGTGTILAGLKSDAFTDADIDEVIESMVTLNRILPVLSTETARGIHAATDITGFGVAGHAMQLAKASSVSLNISVCDIPRFQKTRESLERKHLTKAHSTNREYTTACAFQGLSEEDSLLVFDPQTSGGLLLAVDQRVKTDLLETLKIRFPHVTEIGRVVQKETEPVFFCGS